MNNILWTDAALDDLDAFVSWLDLADTCAIVAVFHSLRNLSPDTFSR